MNQFQYVAIGHMLIHMSNKACLILHNGSGVKNTSKSILDF